MRKFKRIYLSMGAVCLASAMCMSSAFAMKSGQNVVHPESTEQTDSLDQMTELERAKAELAELKEKYAQQTEELMETKLALEMAQKRIAELEKLPDGLKILEKRIAELEARVAHQESQLEEARDIIAQRDAQINQLKAANEHTQDLRNVAQVDSIIHERETLLEEVDALDTEYRTNREELSVLAQADEQIRDSESRRVSCQIRAMVAEEQTRQETKRADAAEAKVAELERRLKEAQSQIIAQAQQIESLSRAQKETVSVAEVTANESQVHQLQNELSAANDKIAKLEEQLDRSLLYRMSGRSGRFMHK